MLTSSTNSSVTPCQRPLKINATNNKDADQNNILFFSSSSKRLIRNVSIFNSSSYSSSMDAINEHGSGASVPFIWESQPGTPKVKYFRDNPLPPLTPPPSYFYSNPQRGGEVVPTKNHSMANLLDSIFMKKRGNNYSNSSRRMRMSSSPVTSSSSSTLSSSWSSPRSSSSCSRPSSPLTGFINSSSKVLQGRTSFGMSSSGTRRDHQLFDSNMVGDEHEMIKECGSPNNGSILCFGNFNGRTRSRGCYASMIKVLLN